MQTNKEPSVLTFDLKWYEVLPLSLLQFFNMIPNTMKLSELFDLQGQRDQKYQFKGLICYCDLHYYAFYRIKIERDLVWCKFDDMGISKKTDWAQIVEDCTRVSAQPMTMFYEKIDEDYPYERELERSFKISSRELTDILKSQIANKKYTVHTGEKMEVHRMASSEIDNPETTSPDQVMKSDDQDVPMPEGEEKPEGPPAGGEIWECDDCHTVNTYEDYICVKCKVLNEVVKMMKDAARTAESDEKMAKRMGEWCCPQCYKYITSGQKCPKCKTREGDTMCYRCHKMFDKHEYEHCPKCYR